MMGKSMIQILKSGTTIERYYYSEEIYSQLLGLCHMCVPVHLICILFVLYVIIKIIYIYI